MENSKSYANYRKRGTYYEQVSIGWLEERGYRIIDKNFRCKFGEIDLIAMDGDVLVFIEVKYRATSKVGAPWEAVGLAKQHRICQCAKWYIMSKHRLLSSPMRFDVISICGSDITHFKNAFNMQ